MSSLIWRMHHTGDNQGGEDKLDIKGSLTAIIKAEKISKYIWIEMLQIVCPKKTQDLLEITSKRAHESIYFCTIVLYYDLGL